MAVNELRFDHLGVVVSRLEKGRRHLADGLGVSQWTEEIVDPVNGVRLQFGLDPAGVCFEILEPLDEQSPVYAALKTGKAILNHVAYRVPDLQAAGARLGAAGWSRTSEPKPAVAYGGRSIQFFVSPSRLVVEMIEAWDHEHIYAAAS